MLEKVFFFFFFNDSYDSYLYNVAYISHAIFFTF